MDNRIYRSRETKMVAGVCGGIADMFNFDPTLARLITAALIIFSGFAFLLVYIMCAIIIPLEPSPGYILKRHQRPEESVQTDDPKPEPAPVQRAGEEIRPVTSEEPSTEKDTLSNDDTVINTKADSY